MKIIILYLKNRFIIGRFIHFKKCNNIYSIIIVLILKDKYKNAFNTLFKKGSRVVEVRNKDEKEELKLENL